LSRWCLVAIAGNVFVDVAVGAVPLVGDLIDFGFRSNRRNLALIRSSIDLRDRSSPQKGQHGRGAENAASAAPEPCAA
jgi:hypothetical protein